MFTKYLLAILLLLFGIANANSSTNTVQEFTSSILSNSVEEYTSKATNQIEIETNGLFKTTTVSQSRNSTVTRKPVSTNVSIVVHDRLQMWTDHSQPGGRRLVCEANVQQDHKPLIRWFRNMGHIPEWDFVVHVDDLGFDSRLRRWRVRSTLSARKPPFLPGTYVCQVDLINHAGRFRPPIKVAKIIQPFVYNQTCTRDVDCVKNLICDHHPRPVCTCRHNQVYIFDRGFCLEAVEYGRKCERSEQCEFFDRNSICYDFQHTCRCKIGYQPISDGKIIRCVPRADIIKPARKYHQDIYKAALIALISFTVIVIGLFLYSLCTRTLMRRARAQTQIPIDDHSTSHVFNVADGLAAMRNVDKPPTYQEIVVQDQMLHGSPPPGYSEALSRSRNERLASILSNMVINSQMEELASRRTASGESSSSTSTTSSETPSLNPTRTDNLSTSTARLIETAGPSRSGVVNPGFDSEA